MDFLSELPIWLMALMIFGLRIADVSLGTVRTIAVVEGLIKVSVILGFVEVLIWITAVSQVIARIHESLFLVVAYAAGFACGNALGIMLEKRLALGVVTLRIISGDSGWRIAQDLRAEGQVLTTFSGEGRDGPVLMIFASCPRRKVQERIGIARQIDPDCFFEVGRTNLWSVGARATAHSGWRAVIKKK